MTKLIRPFLWLLITVNCVSGFSSYAEAEGDESERGSDYFPDQGGGSLAYGEINYKSMLSQAQELSNGIGRLNKMLEGSSKGKKCTTEYSRQKKLSDYLYELAGPVYGELSLYSVIYHGSITYNAECSFCPSKALLTSQYDYIQSKKCREKIISLAIEVSKRDDVMSRLNEYSYKRAEDVVAITNADILKRIGTGGVDIGGVNYGIPICWFKEGAVLPTCDVRDIDPAPIEGQLKCEHSFERLSFAGNGKYPVYSQCILFGEGGFGSNEDMMIRCQEDLTWSKPEPVGANYRYHKIQSLLHEEVCDDDKFMLDKKDKDGSSNKNYVYRENAKKRILKKIDRISTDLFRLKILLERVKEKKCKPEEIVSENVKRALVNMAGPIDDELSIYRVNERDICAFCPSSTFYHTLYADFQNPDCTVHLEGIVNGAAESETTRARLESYSYNKVGGVVELTDKGIKERLKLSAPVPICKIKRNDSLSYSSIPTCDVNELDESIRYSVRECGHPFNDDEISDDYKNNVVYTQCLFHKKDSFGGVEYVMARCQEDLTWSKPESVNDNPRYNELQKLLQNKICIE